MALERIVLNIIPAGEMPVFHCSQYENGRPVIIDLVSSDDDAFLVPEGATVELHCRKVDDNIVTLEPDEVDNNTVTFVSTEQLTACPGDNLCEVVLYADTDPVQTIATLNFILHVEPDPMVGGLTSDTQIHNLTEQIEEITQQVIGDDYYDKTEVDDLLDDKADKVTTYTKSEVDTALNLKADKATTYTKTQVDNALALKANTSDLATVATTGDYDDLLNKPTIPAAQVQSDYAQDDNTQVDYIKNKPDISGMIAAALLAVMPVGTESGSIASFDTEIAAPLVNVSCDIVATGGNGTPDNPNPINGYTEANITRCGVNLVYKTISGSYIDGSGVIGIDNSYDLQCAVVKQGVTYTMSGAISFVGSFFTSEPEIGSTSYDGARIVGGPLTFIAPISGYVVFRTSAGYATPQLELGNTASDYRSYTGNTYTIAFGQTVYGGVLDVTRGKLHVTHGYALIDGVNMYGEYYYGDMVIRPNDVILATTDFTKWKCNIFTPSVSTIGYNTNQKFMFLRQSTWESTGATDAATFNAYCQNTPIQVVYELATPFDIDLTPEVISAVVGENNVYSDTNGDTTVQYKDSIQHYIDQRT